MLAYAVILLLLSSSYNAHAVQLDGDSSGGPRDTADTTARGLLGARLPRGWELREALQVLEPTVYDSAPGPDRPFLPDQLNPCWAGPDGGDDKAGGMRCLPYAMILGGFQSGAASLFTAVYKHPLVLKSDVSRWHFWAEWDKTFEGYMSGIKGAVAKLVKWDKMRAAKGAAVTPSTTTSTSTSPATAPGSPEWLSRQHKVLFDGSSSTLAFYWSPGMRTHRAFMASMKPCWGGCHDKHKEGPERAECLEGCFGPAREEDRKVAARLGIPYNSMSLPLIMSAVYGKRPPRMVMLLRNPVERLYSSYWFYDHYHNKYGKNVEGFRTYVNEQLGVLRQCMAQHDETSCLLHFESWGMTEEKVFFHCDQFLRGVYSVYLEVWLQFFDRKDFLILRSEDYYADPGGVFKQVLSFFNLDPDAITYHKFLTEVDKGDKVGKPKPIVEDDRLWADINRTLYDDVEGRFRSNRMAALAAGGGVQRDGVTVEAGGGAGAGAGVQAFQRPEMPEDVRKTLADFYRPYNTRLAELLGDRDFIKGWD